MRCWPAIALVLVSSACGTAANDIVVSNADTSHTRASNTDALAASDAVASEQPFLSPAGTTTQAAPTTAAPEPAPAPAPNSAEPPEPAEPHEPSESSEPADSAAPDQAAEIAVAAAATPLGAEVFDLEGCPDSPRGAVTDKANQRYWLCMDGQAVTPEIPMTTASENYGLPPVGTYPVFARDENASGINGEPLERFVAFYTTSRGNRIAFHEVVSQDPETVGDLDKRGSSAGCFRVREADSIQVWEFLQIGDPVVVLTN